MTEIDLPTVDRLTRDLRTATATLSDVEARFLVDAYYIIQEDRKRSGNQVRAMKEEPHALLAWFFTQNKTLEQQLKAALERYAQSKQIGQWMMSTYGVGPVIAAGLMAHIDIKLAPTAGHIWRFAGLDPSVKWEKGQKRPWNAGLKTLCWHIGQSFMKFSNRDECFYGHLYRKKKEEYTAKNEALGYAATAAELLPKYNKNTEAYKHLATGKLPPAQIDARARRWAVKLFLSHVQAIWWEMETGQPAAKPYILTREGGHAHEIRPPNWR